MALLTIFLQKLPLNFTDSTAPTHILGTPPLSLRHNEPNPVSCNHRTHTPEWTKPHTAFYTVCFLDMGQDSHTQSHCTPFSICSMMCISACMGEKLRESPFSWSKQRCIILHPEKLQCALRVKALLSQHSPSSWVLVVQSAVAMVLQDNPFTKTKFW